LKRWFYDVGDDCEMERFKVGELRTEEDVITDDLTYGVCHSVWFKLDDVDF